MIFALTFYAILSFACRRLGSWFFLIVQVATFEHEGNKSKNDFIQQLNYTTNQHVTIEVQNDIGNANLLLNESFSNTTIISSCGRFYRLSAREPGLIPLMMAKAQNVAVHALNLSVAFPSNKINHLLDTILPNYTMIQILIFNSTHLPENDTFSVAAVVRLFLFPIAQKLKS